jgi:putative ubiquitin-RnfH superfamily antitoxin RatB of RatAB toxin-antitoxin module
MTTIETRKSIVEKINTGKSRQTGQKEVLKLEEPKKFVVIAVSSQVCATVANQITKRCFDKEFPDRTWKSGKQLKVGIFSKEIAETKAHQANHYVELLMNACPCKSKLNFVVRPD